MIVAIGCPPPPSRRRKPTSLLEHNRGLKDIFERHGFLTYPAFLDNNFIGAGEADVKYLRDHAKLWGDGRIRFAILPDHKPEEALQLQADFPGIDWIWPCHSLSEDLTPYKWIGFPHDDKRRDYSLGEFLEATRDKKRWYLGYWESRDYMELLNFDAMDTTIPTGTAGLYGEIFVDFKTRKKVSHLGLYTEEIIELSLLNLKVAIRELQQLGYRKGRLTEFQE